MHRLKNMKETLVNCVQAQLANIKDVNTEELGEAIDMIKDLEEAIYYCTITKAMEKQEEEEKKGQSRYYMMPYYLGERDMDKYMGRMYYSESQPRNSSGEFTSYNKGGNGGGSRSSTSYYHEREFPFDLRDEREGRSPMSRRMYMESKEMHKDKAQKIKELEKYMQELSEDIVEMIEDASPEEK